MDRYEIKSFLGKGGEGMVYLCRTKRDNKKVAIKKIICHNLDEANKYLRELSKVRNLSFDYIEKNTKKKKVPKEGFVKYIDIFLEEKKSEFYFYVCIVMEYYPDDLGTLIERIYHKENRRMKEPMIVDLILQICNSVSFMHSRKLIHRDLKPENIFLIPPSSLSSKEKVDQQPQPKNSKIQSQDDSYKIRIGDFGYSIDLFGKKGMASSFCGSQNYLSPEIMRNEKYSYKVDCFSIGMMMYQMCSGKNVALQVELVSDFPKTKRTIHKELRKYYSNELIEIMFKFLQVNPKLRISCIFGARQLKKLKLKIFKESIQKHSFSTASPPKKFLRNKQKKATVSSPTRGRSGSKFGEDGFGGSGSSVSGGWQKSKDVGNPVFFLEKRELEQSSSSSVLFPPEIFTKICSFLQFSSITRLSQVCHFWRLITFTDKIWIIWYNYQFSTAFTISPISPSKKGKKRLSISSNVSCPIILEKIKKMIERFKKFGIYWFNFEHEFLGWRRKFINRFIKEKNFENGKFIEERIDLKLKKKNNIRELLKFPTIKSLRTKIFIQTSRGNLIIYSINTHEYLIKRPHHHCIRDICCITRQKKIVEEEIKEEAEEEEEEDDDVKYYITGSEDRKIAIWNKNFDFPCLFCVIEPTIIRCLCILKNSKGSKEQFLVSGGFESLRIYKIIEKQSQIQPNTMIIKLRKINEVLQCHKGAIYSISNNYDQSLLFTCGEDKNINIFSCKKRRNNLQLSLIKVINNVHKNYAWEILFSNNQLISNSCNGEVGFWDPLNDFKLLKNIENKLGKKNCINCIDVNENYLVCGCRNGSIELYDRKTFKLLWKNYNFQSKVCSEIILSPSGDSIFVSFYNRRTKRINTLQFCELNFSKYFPIKTGNTIGTKN